MSVEVGRPIPQNVLADAEVVASVNNSKISIDVRSIARTGGPHKFFAPETASEVPAAGSIAVDFTNSIESLLALRSQFASGRAGEISFNEIVRALKAGDGCDARVLSPDEAIESCGRVPTCTFGADVVGVNDYAVLLSCSQEHWLSLAEDVRVNVDSGLRDSYDYNGFGRA